MEFEPIPITITVAKSNSVLVYFTWCSNCASEFHEVTLIKGWMLNKWCHSYLYPLLKNIPWAARVRAKNAKLNILSYRPMQKHNEKYQNGIVSTSKSHPWAPWSFMAHWQRILIFRYGLPSDEIQQFWYMVCIIRKRVSRTVDIRAWVRSLVLHTPRVATTHTQ